MLQELIMWHHYCFSKVCALQYLLITYFEGAKSIWMLQKQYANFENTGAGFILQ